MKTQTEILSKLHEHQSPTPSKWRENAEWRIANKSWLRYSQRIDMMMLDRMEGLGLTKKRLQRKWGVLNNIYRATENLYIETISKIESALGLKIMEMSAISH